MKRTPNLAAALLAALALAPAIAADAAKPASASAPAVVNGVALARLCDTCGVVTAVNRETRKGKASGVGAVGGAVAGGVVGNKATDGGTLGTVGGAAVGGVIGNAIEKQVKKRKVWATTVTMKDGSVKKFDAEADPGWKAGAVVQVGADGQPVVYKR